jgi:AcrR family transcriptional regulator
MPRDASATKARLLRAAERRFARDGVGGTRMVDLVRDAGQANESAVSYHFGSRKGLLSAIAEKHLAVMDLRRNGDLADADIRTVIDAIVVPTASLLRTDDGRDFLRITEQLAGFSGVRQNALATPIRGSVLAGQLSRLDELLRTTLDATYTRERTGALVTFLTASLAERARSIERGDRQALSHVRYVDNLVDMLTAAIQA